MILCDEGHRLKNETSDMYFSVRFLRADHKVIANATLIINKVADAAGLCCIIYNICWDDQRPPSELHLMEHSMGENGELIPPNFKPNHIDEYLK